MVRINLSKRKKINSKRRKINSKRRKINSKRRNISGGGSGWGLSDCEQEIKERMECNKNIVSLNSRLADLKAELNDVKKINKYLIELFEYLQNKRKFSRDDVNNYSTEIPTWLPEEKSGGGQSKRRKINSKRRKINSKRRNISGGRLGLSDCKQEIFDSMVCNRNVKYLNSKVAGLEEYLNNFKNRNDYLIELFKYLQNQRKFIRDDVINYQEPLVTDAARDEVDRNVSTNDGSPGPSGDYNTELRSWKYTYRTEYNNYLLDKLGS